MLLSPRVECLCAFICIGESDTTWQVFPFFGETPSPIRTDAPMGFLPHLKVKGPPTGKHPPPPHWNEKPPSQEIILRKNSEKLETVIRTRVSLIKKRNSTKAWFFHLEHSNFVTKVKPSVWKYYITWLIDLANKVYTTYKNYWFQFMRCVIENCFGLLKALIRRKNLLKDVF